MNYCSTCGTRLEHGVTLCPNCGTAVSAASMGTEAPPRPSPLPGSMPTGGFGAPLATMAAPPTSNAAIISLVLGILAYIFLPFLGAIGAVIAGHMARSEIRQSHGRMGGDGLALAGLILGYSNLALGCIAIAFMTVIFGIIGAAAS